MEYLNNLNVGEEGDHIDIKRALFAVDISKFQLDIAESFKELTLYLVNGNNVTEKETPNFYNSLSKIYIALKDGISLLENKEEVEKFKNDIIMSVNMLVGSSIREVIQNKYSKMLQFPLSPQ
jgi:hypothetical protein